MVKRSALTGFRRCSKREHEAVDACDHLVPAIDILDSTFIPATDLCQSAYRSPGLFWDELFTLHWRTEQQRRLLLEDRCTYISCCLPLPSVGSGRG